MTSLLKYFNINTKDYFFNNTDEEEEHLELAFNNEDFHPLDYSKWSEVEKKWDAFITTCVEGPFARFAQYVNIPGILEHKDTYGKTCLKILILC